MHALAKINTAEVLLRKQTGKTPLHLAVGCTQPDTVQVLLEAGANMVAVDDVSLCCCDFCGAWPQGPQ